MARRPATRRQVNRLPPERRVSDIMKAAKEVFEEKGYQDALITDIAKRAGVVEGSIYRFFVNKRELLVKVVEHWLVELLTQDAEQFAAVQGLQNQIRFIVYNHLVSIRRDPALARLALQEIRPSADYRKPRLFALFQAYAHRVVEVVKAGIASGELREDVSPILVRDMLFGSIEHRTWAFLRKEGDFDANQMADAISEMIYRGIVKDPQPRPEAATLSRLETITQRLENLLKPTSVKQSKTSA